MNTQISGTEYRVQKKNHTDYLIFDRGPRELNGEKKKKMFQHIVYLLLDISMSQKQIMITDS